MIRRRNTTFLVRETTPGVLQQIASALGLVHDRGPAFGSGSASQLLDLIANCAITIGPDNVAAVLRHLVAQREAMIARIDEYKATH